MDGDNKQNGDAAKSSMDDTLDRMVSVAAAGERPAFLPSSTWQGSKDGYYFGTSDLGTGYHLDSHQQQQQEQDTVSTPSSRKKRRLLSGQDLLKLAEASVDPNSKIIELTPKGIKSAIMLLRKLHDKNQLQRAKHADNPESFMESEVALHEQISAFSGVATGSSELYDVVLEEGLLQDFLSLLSHDNSDVALTVVKVLVEWLDPAETSGQLFQAVVDNQVLKGCIDNLGRLDLGEQEDTDGMEDIMTLVENVMDIDLMNDTETVATHICDETRLISWLFQQISQNQSGRAAEILSLLLQQPQVHSTIKDLTQIPPYTCPLVEDNSKPSTIDGMEILLQAIALFRKSQPPSETECDFLENSCLALASALTFSPEPNIDKFLEAQGVELVLRCLKEKVHAGGVSLKLLDLQSRRACEHVVEAGGLKYIFPIFSCRSIPKPLQTSKKARKEWLHMLERYSIQILYSWTRYLTDESPHDAKARVLVKFVEDDCFKCSRLVELLLKYDEKARLAEYNFYRSTDEEDELAALHAKLKGGGDLFHRLGAIAAFCCVGSKKCHRHIMDQLTLQKSGIGVIKTALEEFASVLDDGDQKQQLQRYMELV